MRIAQVSPLYERVPPVLYGGTERVVYFLTEELVRLGHDVTLFASGDSETSARLVAPCKRALRLDTNCVDPLPHHVLMLEQVFRDTARFDLIHLHVDYLHFLISRRQATPHVTTLHGRLDLPDLVPLYREFDEVPVISISDAQRAPLPWLNWQATVHHGLPLNLFEFHEQPGDYLLFLGRISPEKGCTRAVEIAKRTGLPLKIAAKVDKADREYYETALKPLLAHPLIEFVGEVGGAEKEALLGGAYALVFPIDWSEPFGLVMIEALACGTPVIACRRGSVPEVIEDGVTGFVVDGVEEAVRAVARVPEINRRMCRAVFEQRFSAARMAEDYLAVYSKMIARRRMPATA